MKLIFAFAFLFFAIECVIAAPTVEEIDDDVARLRVKNTLETVEAILTEDENDDEDDTGDKYVKALVNTVDRECIFNQYKKYHYTHDLIEESVLRTKISQFTEEHDTSLIRFATVAASCSNKIDPILRFIFDILFSIGELTDAFRDDPPFNRGMRLIYGKSSCLTNFFTQSIR